MGIKACKLGGGISKREEAKAQPQPYREVWFDSYPSCPYSLDHKRLKFWVRKNQKGLAEKLPWSSSNQEKYSPWEIVAKLIFAGVAAQIHITCMVHKTSFKFVLKCSCTRNSPKYQTETDTYSV